MSNRYPAGQNGKGKYFFMLGAMTGVILFHYTKEMFLLLHKLLTYKIQQYKCSRILTSTSPKKDDTYAIDRIQRTLEIGKTMLHQLVRIFIRDVERGLENNYSTLKCIPCHIVGTPDGTEKGEYLVFVLGGSSYRVALVNLLGKGRYKCIENKSELPERIKIETSEVLFDFCVDKIIEFYEQEGLDKNKEMKLAISFAFPVDQRSVKAGKLLWWTKGFAVDNAVNRCVTEMFEEAIKKKSLNIKIEALINDAVAIFLASSYSDDSTQLGVVLGTGNNAAYLEDISNVRKLVTEAKYNIGDKMIVNMEWGNWGSDGSILPTTIFDVRVDRTSYNPRMQIYEKMISGLYIGEVARYVILDLISTGELFKGVSYPKLQTPHSFTVVHMSRIERDYSLDLSSTRNLLEDFYEINDITITDLKMVRKVCELVSTRAARIASVGIAAALTKIKKVGSSGSTIAINGSVFEHYPHFRNKMMDAFRELFGVAAEEILLVQSTDGPIIGAAIAAAMSENYDPNNPNYGRKSSSFIDDS